MPRILYLATADARGHLMRAQLLVHALQRAGAQVDVLSTSHEGLAFLAQFGVPAQLLSTHYAVQFDAQQNMLRRETNRNVAHYVFRPGRMLRDVRQLARHFRRADLVVNDSFHPALLCMGLRPAWGSKLVHVHGGSLQAALRNNFEGQLPGALGRAWSRVFARIIDAETGAARCRIEHDFGFDAPAKPAPSQARSGPSPKRITVQLPTPVAVLADTVPAPNRLPVAAVYLNPHFRDLAMADALSSGLRAAGLALHGVGEGLAGHGDWLAVDTDWASRAAQASLIVSAPGMAALSIARVYQRPLLLLLTDQPEQASNAARAAELGLRHEVLVWRGDAAAFAQQVQAAAQRLAQPQPTAEQAQAGRERAQQRLAPWVAQLLALCPQDSPSSGSGSGSQA